MDLSLISNDGQPSTSQGETQVVAFTLCGRTFGLPVSRVIGFIEPAPVTPVPLAPSFVVGIFDWCGQTATLVDLACRLGLSPDVSSNDRIFLLVSAGDAVMALQANTVSGLLSVEQGRMERPSAPEIQEFGSYCSDVFHHRGKAYPVLDPDRIAGAGPVTANPAEDDASAPAPRLRLVSSSVPPMAMQQRKPESGMSDELSLFHALGGADGIRRLAEGIAFRILDDDSLNPYLGTLDAQQLPGLIDTYLTGLVTGRADKARANDAIVTRVLTGGGSHDAHHEKSLAHIGNALFSAACPIDVTDELLHRLETEWAMADEPQAG